MQAQVKKRLLADLLANKKAITPQLRFLKATDIGEKKRAKKREKERKPRNDQAGEELSRKWIKFNKKTELGGKKLQILG